MKLYRELIKKPIWKQSTPEQKSILITILCMVNHDTEEWEWKGKKYLCKPGQKITSLQNIAKEAGKGISIKNVRTAIERFEKLEFLANESTKQSRLVTVLNWELYQSAEENRQSNRQRGGKGVATNKNDKNDKNIIKDFSLEFEKFRQRYDDETLKLIDQYFGILRTTRVSGKIADSVINQVYTEMDKHPPVIVKHACNVVIRNPALHSKKENYFYGIMRNTQADEAERKLSNAPQERSKLRDMTNYDPRR